MNQETAIKHIVTAATVGIGFIVGNYLAEAFTTRAEIRKINRNRDLDLLALDRTQKALTKEILDGKTKNLTLSDFGKRFNERFAFEKIAVREDHN